MRTKKQKQISSCALADLIWFEDDGLSKRSKNTVLAWRIADVGTVSGDYCFCGKFFVNQVDFIGIKSSALYFGDKSGGAAVLYSWAAGGCKIARKTLRAR